MTTTGNAALPRRILISGCSSGGKSTLLAALAQRGHAVVEEPGRRVLRAGDPHPGEDLAGFLDACIELAVEDHRTARGTVFFDRGLLDALSGLDAIGHPGAETRAEMRRLFRYAPLVLMAPPWPAIYLQDNERAHGLADAIREYDRLTRDIPRAGYRTVLLRRASVPERVRQVEALLHDWSPGFGAAMA